MSQPFLKYQLVDGFIHDWLVAGPLAIEVTDLERLNGPEYKFCRAFSHPEILSLF